MRRLRGQGLYWLVGAIWYRLFPAKLAFEANAMSALRNARGIEVGGPSAVFKNRGILPAYSVAAALDNVNFSRTTAWESDLSDGSSFRFNTSKPAGTQWIREAGALNGIADTSYDFVLTSHCLEHLANPLAALREWRRVTRPGGHLLLILPDPSRSFDHHRPITELHHLQNDFEVGVSEDDTTHFTEVLALHDLARDPDAGTTEEFRQRVLLNSENRCLHHHVFDLSLVASMLQHSGWRVLAQERVRPLHLVTWATKEGD